MLSVYVSQVQTINRFPSNFAGSDTYSHKVASFFQEKPKRSIVLFRPLLSATGKIMQEILHIVPFEAKIQFSCSLLLLSC